jgi:hypothetical protein
MRVYLGIGTKTDRDAAYKPERCDTTSTQMPPRKTTAMWTKYHKSTARSKSFQMIAKNVFCISLSHHGYHRSVGVVPYTPETKSNQMSPHREKKSNYKTYGAIRVYLRLVHDCQMLLRLVSCGSMSITAVNVSYYRKVLHPEPTPLERMYVCLTCVVDDGEDRQDLSMFSMVNHLESLRDGEIQLANSIVTHIGWLMVASWQVGCLLGAPILHPEGSHEVVDHKGAIDIGRPSIVVQYATGSLWYWCTWSRDDVSRQSVST